MGSGSSTTSTTGGNAKQDSVNVQTTPRNENEVTQPEKEEKSNKELVRQDAIEEKWSNSSDDETCEPYDSDAHLEENIDNIISDLDNEMCTGLIITGYTIENDRIRYSYKLPPLRNPPRFYTSNMKHPAAPPTRVRKPSPSMSEQMEVEEEIMKEFEKLQRDSMSSACSGRLTPRYESQTYSGLYIQEKVKSCVEYHTCRCI